MRRISRRATRLRARVYIRPVYLTASELMPYIARIAGLWRRGAYILATLQLYTPKEQTLRRLGSACHTPSSKS